MVQENYYRNVLHQTSVLRLKFVPFWNERYRCECFTMEEVFYRDKQLCRTGFLNHP
jgi:hypothetical protein